MTTNDTLKRIAFGAVGGAVGTYLMEYYWKAATAVHGHDPRALTRDEPPHGLDEISVVGDQTEGDEGSTEAVGRIVHETVTGTTPAEEKKERLSMTVHWSYGILVSALYGAIRGKHRMPDVAGGALFGTALWAAGDETMVPLLGLSKGPTAYPMEQHVHRLGAHLFYGIAAAAVTQGLLHALSPARSRREVMLDAVKTYATWKTLKSAAEAVGGASKSIGKMKLSRRTTPLQRMARSTRRFTHLATNGTPRAAMKTVVKTGRLAVRSASEIFS